MDVPNLSFTDVIVGISGETFVNPHTRLLLINNVILPIFARTTVEMNAKPRPKGRDGIYT